METAITDQPRSYFDRPIEVPTRWDTIKASLREFLLEKGIDTKWLDIPRPLIFSPCCRPIDEQDNVVLDKLNELHKLNEINLEEYNQLCRNFYP